MSFFLYTKRMQHRIEFVAFVIFGFLALIAATNSNILGILIAGVGCLLSGEARRYRLLPNKLYEAPNVKIAQVGGILLLASIGLTWLDAASNSKAEAVRQDRYAADQRFVAETNANARRAQQTRNKSFLANKPERLDEFRSLLKKGELLLVQQKLAELSIEDADLSHVNTELEIAKLRIVIKNTPDGRVTRLDLYAQLLRLTPRMSS